MTTFQEQSALQRVREHVPLPDDRVPKADDAVLSILPDALARKAAKAGAAVTAAENVCMALPADTSTSDADKAYTALRDAQDAAVEAKRDCDAWLDDNRVKISEGWAAYSAETASSIIALLDKAVELATDYARRKQATGSAFEGAYSGRRWVTQYDPRTQQVPAGELLVAARTAVTKLLPQPPVERVSSLEYRRRVAAGLDVSNVRVAHAPEGLGPRG